MKKVLTAVALIVAATVAHSNIFVRWQGLSGFYRNDYTPLLEVSPGNYTNTVAFLIFSPSGAFWSQNLLPGTFTIGDEIILDVQAVNYVGDEYGPVYPQTIQTNFMAGFLYARVFDQGTTFNPATVTNGLWYYQSPMTQTVFNNTLNPTVFNIHSGSALDPNYPDADILSRQVVPEPATLAILALGGAVVAIRRKVLG